MRTLLFVSLALAPLLARAQVPPEPEADETPSTPRPLRGPGFPRGRPGVATPAPPPGPPPGTRGPAPGSTPPPPPAPAPGASKAPPANAPGANAGSKSAVTLRPDAKCVPLQGRFMLTFNKAEILDVLEQASRWTCRNFIYTDEIVKGKISLLSKTPVTADEAYAAFLVALNTNNISIYATGRYYKLIRTADAKKNPIPLYTDPESGTPANEQPITKVIRLLHTDADQMKGVVANFVSPQGADVQSIPPDTLIITDVGLNVRRIERLLESIDRAGAGDLVRIIQVRYAPAKDMADKLNQIFQAQGGRPGVKGPLLAPARGPAPAAPAAPPGAPAATGGGDRVSVSKIIPDDRTNKLIVIADEKSYQRILELVEQLDVPGTASGGIHVVFLRFANAEDLSQTLSNLAQGLARNKATGAAAVPGAAGQPARLPTPAMPATPPAPTPTGGEAAVLFSGEVKVTADKAQNALIIQASGSDFANMQRIIDKLDRARRQIFVETVILEVNVDDSAHVGVGMHTAVPINYKGQTAVLPIASEPGTVSSLNLQSVVQLGGFLTGFAGPVSAELSQLGINIPSIGVFVQALETLSDTKVLSTPHVVATDNEEAEITVGQNVPFQAGYAPPGLSSLLSGATGGTTASSTLGTALGLGGLSSLYAPIQRQPVELRLKIKPQINEGGSIRLTMEVQNEEITSTDPVLGPTTSKRSVKSQVVVHDQSTVVIGGLIQERNIKTVKKVPFFGDLPLLGFFFRDTTTEKQKTNLLVFLTPYIIRDDSDYRRIYERKRKEQQQFIEQFYGRTAAYNVETDFGRKSGPFGHVRFNVQDETSKLENGGPGRAGERVTVPGEAPRGPEGQAPQGTPPALPIEPQTQPRTPAESMPQEGTPVDRLEVQPEVPLPGEPAPQSPAIHPFVPVPQEGQPSTPPSGAPTPAPQEGQPSVPPPPTDSQR